MFKHVPTSLDMNFRPASFQFFFNIDANFQMKEAIVCTVAQQLVISQWNLLLILTLVGKELLLLLGNTSIKFADTWSWS